MEARFTFAAISVAASLAAGAAPAAAATGPPPPRLADTGLFAEGATDAVRAGVESFSPQYPLWSDGAAKRRWISLPAGAAIDGARAAAWEFPRGTKFWKEFSREGRRIETRTIERLPDGGWRFAAYVWNEDGTEAALAPVDGTTVALPGGARYAIPSEADCRACHEGAAAPVLGFSALQLSPDRDPLAPHAEPPRAGSLDLRGLVASGRLVNFPQALVETPPRIAAPTPAGRAALGYLHANCGHCHADPALTGAAVPVELQLALDPADRAAGTKAIRRLLASESRYRPQGAADARHVVPGDAARGSLPARMRSRDPRNQMPPLGTAMPDAEAIALLERWINEDLKSSEEEKP